MAVKPMPKVWRYATHIVALSFGIVGILIFANWSKDQMIDKDWDKKVNACVTAMKAEQLGHSTGESPCEALNEDGKREAAFRWARERGAL